MYNNKITKIFLCLASLAVEHYTCNVKVMSSILMRGFYKKIELKYIYKIYFNSIKYD